MFVFADHVRRSPGSGITVGFHRLFTHRSFKTRRSCAACSPSSARWRSRDPSSPGSPTTASTTPSPTARATRTARTSTTARAARRARGPRPRARRLAVPAHPPRPPDALRARPASPIRSSRCVDRSFVLWASAARPARVRARLAIGGTLHDGLTGLLWGGAVRMLVLHHVDLLDQLAVPLLRPPRVRRPRTSRATCSGSPRSRSARRGTTTTTPSRPRPRHGLRALAVRPLGRGHPRAREARAGLGRRPRHARSGRPPRRGRGVEHRPAARRPRRGALPDRPVPVGCWDGTRAAVHQRRGGPTFTVRSPRGARPRAARARPARPRPRLRLRRARGRRHRRGAGAARRLAAAAGRRAREGAARRAPPCAPAALRRLPRAPAAELRPRGRRHSVARDRAPVRHHYDVSNEFFALFLDESMTYSCAIFSRGADTLEEAQRHEARARLHEARRCSRASACSTSAAAGARFAVHAAREHGVARHRHHALGAAGRARARERAREHGRRRPRRDPRHGLPRAARRALRRDRLDRHGRARRRGEHRRLRRARSRGCSSPAAGCSTTASRGCATASPRPARSPSATCSPTPRRCTSRASCRARGRRLRDATTSRASARTTPDAARTGRGGSRSDHDEAVRLAGAERMRVWRLYLRAARRGFETGFTSVYQVLADRA